MEHNNQRKKFFIACYSPKGGSGKTTLATQIAIMAKKNGRSVCFYDLDKQKTATYYLWESAHSLKPDEILHDITIAPKNKETDFIILDCPPNIDFVPPKEFLIIAPTLAASFDIHAYRKIFELEEAGYSVIRVLNQFDGTRKLDSEAFKQLSPCCFISETTGIPQTLTYKRHIFNTSHFAKNRIKNEFLYLAKRIAEGEAERIGKEDIDAISNYSMKLSDLPIVPFEESGLMASKKYAGMTPKQILKARMKEYEQTKGKDNEKE